MDLLSDIYSRGRSRNLRKGAGPSRSFPLPFCPFPPSLSSLLLEIGPLKPAIGSGSAVSSPSGAENEFGGL